MTCWHCQSELIWGDDHEIEVEHFENFRVTNLSCPNCDAYVAVYYPKD